MGTVRGSFVGGEMPKNTLKGSPVNVEPDDSSAIKLARFGPQKSPAYTNNDVIEESKKVAIVAPSKPITPQAPNNKKDP